MNRPAGAQSTAHAVNSREGDCAHLQEGETPTTRNQSASGFDGFVTSNRDYEEGGRQMEHDSVKNSVLCTKSYLPVSVIRRFCDDNSKPLLNIVPLLIGWVIDHVIGFPPSVKR